MRRPSWRLKEVDRVKVGRNYNRKDFQGATVKFIKNAISGFTLKSYAVL